MNTKRKKKSLVGWIDKDWEKFGFPNKWTNKKRNFALLGKTEKEMIKVCITIEQLPQKARGGRSFGKY